MIFIELQSVICMLGQYRQGWALFLHNKLTAYSNQRRGKLCSFKQLPGRGLTLATLYCNTKDTNLIHFAKSYLISQVGQLTFVKTVIIY